jgi:hypothetical protein
MRSLMLVLLLPALGDAEADRILDRFRAARPADGQLSLYRNDWAPSLAEARERAGKEGRPIFLVCIGNLNGYDSLYTGHC